MRTVTLPAIELRQDGTRLLLTKMRASDLPDFTKVDPFDASKSFDHPDQGYQRPAETPRIKKFANWLRRESEDGGKVRMPTAILLSARSTDVVLANGTITLKSSNKLPLIDGQHRKRGFEYAINDKNMAQFADYEIPVVIMQDIDKIGEMKQFKTVNGEQKSVRTDLVNMILTQLVEHEGEESVKESEHWKVIASHVVKRLNEDVGGPWFDQIVMPDQREYTREEQLANSELRHRRVARATSFITALKPIEQYLAITRPGHVSIQDRANDLFNIIDAFWRSVRSMNQTCFEKADDYVLLKTPGIFALHRLCLSIMKDMYVGRRDWIEPEFKHMLASCDELSNPQFWFVGEKGKDNRGDGARYGSMKGFTELADLLYGSLRS